jgi:class 3 adenylate cyclase/tetratricopeptide (TPR) repeat protein
VQPTAVAVPAPGGPVAERRVTSVLFGDLAGFTALSESRDAEEVRELLSRYFATARTVIERYGGVVEKFIGDAVMAVWGVPVAHEDDPERAVRAGLDLVDAVSELGEAIGLATLAMRVGIVTGEVAVTLGATGEGMVAGDAVNTASRVQSAASSGEVWVDEATRATTSASVMYDAVGVHELKGKSEPMPLFAARQIVAAVGGARRVDGLEAPLEGRDRDLRLVKELLHATIEEGRPRLVAIIGPAGVGKSRMGWELDKYIDGINSVVRSHRGRCLSYGDGVAFWALAEIVRSRLGILEGDQNPTVLERLRAGLSEYVPDHTEQAWLLPRVATLIGVGELVAPGQSFPRDDLFSAWRTFLERVATYDDSVAALVQIDDLQWADEGLLAFLDHVLELAQAPIFVLTMSRPELIERRPGFGSGKRATSLYLEPLPDHAMEGLVDGLVSDLPSALRSAIVERSDGIPLFAVETVRALIDRDAVVPREGRYVLSPDAADLADLTDLELPGTLHNLIAARLDSLPTDEKRVVHDAAVLGQSFSRTGLAAVHAATGGGANLDEVLASLVRKEVFAVVSDPFSSERGQFRFVQALVRTVAYDTLARRDRKLRHVAAAEFLAAEPDAETIPAVLASHYLDAHSAAGQDDDAAQLASRAIDLLQRAAARARELGAPAEARRHLEAALDLETDPTSIAHLTEEAARAANAMGAFTDAAALAERSRLAYEQLGRELDAARVLAIWGESQIMAGVGQHIVEALAAAYAKFVDLPDAGPVAAQLALQVARAYYLSIGDAEQSIPWFDRAVVLGEELEDLPLLASTLASYGGAFVLAGRSRMGLGLLRISLELAREIDQPQAELRPLNNLVSFLVTRDLDAARGFADVGLPLVRRLGDREIGMSLVGSTIHLYWTSGEWDAAIGLHEEMELGKRLGAIETLIAGYNVLIQAARGLPLEIPSTDSDVLQGMRTDAIVDTTRQFLDAASLRADGDVHKASELSAKAAISYAQLTGIDDDFPMFWITAVEDAVDSAEVERAQALVALVADAPHGHVPRYLRAQLPRLRAQVNSLSGRNDTVDEDFRAAESALGDFGAPYYLARTQLEHAVWLQAQGRSEESLPLFNEAEQAFTALGATPWVTRSQQARTVSV